MQVLAVTSDDHDEVFSIWENSVRATHDFLNEEDIRNLIPIVKETAIPNTDLYCVRNAEHVMGGFMGIAGDEVTMLFVSPEFFGQGIGTTLMNYAVHELKCTRVDVNEQNLNALNFYQKLGFKVVARSPLDGQGNPFPLLHMQYKISN